MNAECKVIMSAKRVALPGVLRSLSGKLLLLTMVFIMLGEILIFFPVIASFRQRWLQSRLAQAEIVVLANHLNQNDHSNAQALNSLLSKIGIYQIIVQPTDQPPVIIAQDETQPASASYDLRQLSWRQSITDAIEALFSKPDQVIAVTGVPPDLSGQAMTITLPASSLHKVMVRFALNVLLISLVLSVLVAAMLYATLQYVLIQPMRRLTCNMVTFSAQPEDLSRIIMPSHRRDEMGVAEDQLHDMQVELTSLLKQQSHLAALGLAVSKVAHDLRNMLTSAQLISDHLASVDDPTVKRLTPKLITSLDRAITFLTQTLKFSRTQEPSPQRDIHNLRAITIDVIDMVLLEVPARTQIDNQVPEDLAIDADRDQLMRILSNLVRNAVQAIQSREESNPKAPEGQIVITAWYSEQTTHVRVCDNGPGIPPLIKDRLFEAFQSAARNGGTGLGLTIAAELVHGHGGSLTLVEQAETGTCFVLTIPDRDINIRSLPCSQGEGLRLDAGRTKEATILQSPLRARSSAG